MTTCELAKKVLGRIGKASEAGNHDQLDAAMKDGWTVMRRARMFPLDHWRMVDVLRSLSAGAK